MVRLREYLNTHALRKVAAFQFQYGAIEGASIALNSWSATWFQFQYGAIEGPYWQIE